MDYSKIIEMDNLTIEDCQAFYDENISTVLHNGKVENMRCEE